MRTVSKIFLSAACAMCGHAATAQTTDVASSNRRVTTAVIVSDSTRPSTEPLSPSDLQVTLDPVSVVGAGSVVVGVTLPAITCDTRCPVDRTVVVTASDDACSFPQDPTSDALAAPSKSYSFRLQGSHTMTLTSTVTANCAAVATDRAVQFVEETSTVIPASASLSLVAPDLLDLVMRTKSIASGGTGTGRVRLNAAAITDMTVELRSADTALAVVPASVVVPAGKITADFPINAGTVGAETSVRIDATCKDSGKATSQRARLTILPAP